MSPDLSDADITLLADLLKRTIDYARYPLSPRVTRMREILAKLRPEPVREPLPPIKHCAAESETAAIILQARTACLRLLRTTGRGGRGASTFGVSNWLGNRYTAGFRSTDHAERKAAPRSAASANEGTMSLRLSTGEIIKARDFRPTLMSL